MAGGGEFVREPPRQLRVDQQFHTASGSTRCTRLAIDATRDAEAKVPAEFKAVQWTRLPERLKTKFSEGAPTFAAQFRFNPILDPFRGQPRFRALAAEVDQFYAAPTKGGAKSAADRPNEPR